MLFKIYAGESQYCAPGDVVFAVFEPGTSERSDYQHAALFCARRPVLISSVHQQIPVFEIVQHLNRGEWPSDVYQVQLVGHMIRNGEPLSAEIRSRVISIARTIERRGRILRDNLKWDLTYYKYVFPNPRDPAKAQQIRFTCAGFVEYCYEEALQDIINDPECRQNHPDGTCNASSIPLYRYRSSLIHRLFPGYLMAAFDVDIYPFDFERVLSVGVDPRVLQFYPFPEDAISRLRRSE